MVCVCQRELESLTYFSDQARGSTGSQRSGGCLGPWPGGKHQSWGDLGLQTRSPVYTALCIQLPIILVSLGVDQKSGYPRRPECGVWLHMLTQEQSHSASSWYIPLLKRAPHSCGTPRCWLLRPCLMGLPVPSSCPSEVSPAWWAAGVLLGELGQLPRGGDT